MENFDSVQKLVVKWIIMGVCCFIVTACSNEHDEFRNLFEPIQWNKANVEVYLGNECLDDVEVEFSQIPDTNLVKASFHGILPEDDININFIPSMDGYGNIHFNGADTMKFKRFNISGIECLRCLGMEGIYKKSNYKRNNNPADVGEIKINLTYNVPHHVLSSHPFIGFSKYTGFLYSQHTGYISKDPAEENCAALCRRITDAIGRYYNSIAFEFGYDGQISVVFRPSGYSTGKFRYWIGNEDKFRGYTVYIEDGKEFYRQLFQLLVPHARYNVPDYIVWGKFAKIFISDEEISGNNLAHRIYFMDDAQYNIFPFLRANLLTEGEWSEAEEQAFSKMENDVINNFKKQSDPQMVCVWAFGTLQKYARQY